MDLVRKSLRKTKSDSKISCTNQYENNYTLNIEKSLKKKLESTKRTEIEYENTKGGITSKLDAVSFELFIHACEKFYGESNLHEFTKTTATDRQSNNVQYTFHIKTKDSDPFNYTINAYLTKCSLLINGRNTQHFINNDVIHIHKIMSNTTIQGAKVNVELLNKNLASKLESALESIDHSKSSLEPTSAISNPHKAVEKCHKCNRICKSRAVLCQFGHWVHYSCDKLSEKDIQTIEKDEQNYICKKCSNLSLKSPSRCITLPNSSEIFRNKSILSTGTSTLAKTLLLEEIQCNGCDVTLDKIENKCVNCDMTFHNQCLDKTTDQCFSCIGIEDQDTVINSVNFHQTVVKQTSPNLQNLDINNSGTTPNLITSVSSAKNTANLDKQSDHNTVNTQNEIQTSSKMKELRTLELKLKKKEEQLKIKEAMLNEDMKEKTKVMDRLHKAEIRNIELENTIKTLQTRIEQIPINSVVNNSNPTNSQSKIKEEEDELIIGMRKRVTKFVLNKIDKELNKLESNNDHSEHNTETSSNPQYNYERQNYSDNYWNYNNGYSGQYRDTQPYYNYHHNWQQGHNEDSSSYQNTEITHNICTDNLIEIQPTNVHTSTINSKPVNTQHTTYCDKNKLPKFNCNLEKVNRNSQNSEKHTNQSQTQNSEHYFSTIGQPLYFHPTPQQTHFLQLASLNPSRYKEPNL